MAEKQVVIRKDGQEVERVESLNGYSIAEGYEVQTYVDGTVISADVKEGGLLQALGGEISGTRIFQGGLFEVQTGTVDDTLVLSGGRLVAQGTVTDTSVIGGTASIRKGGQAQEVFVSGEGVVEVLEGGAVSDLTMFAGTVSLAGGYGLGLTIRSGFLEVGKDSLAYGVCLTEDTASFVVSKGGMVLGMELDGASGEILGGGVACNTELLGYYIEGEEGKYYDSTMTLHAGAWHFGTLFIDSRSTLTAEDGSFIDFTLEGVTPGKTALLNDFTRISGAPNFTMTVSEEQAAGIYSLAGNAGAFDAAVTLLCDDFGTMTMAVGDTAVYHNSVYALGLNDGTLSATVTDFAMSGSTEHLSWGDINGAESCMLQIASAKSTLSLEMDTRSVDLLGLSNGDYAWRVRNAAEADNWQTGAVFSQTEAAEGPQRLEAETNGATDLFFAKADGVWGGDYCAENVFTGERRSMKGMARITDIFAGSEDASILVLCGDGNVAEKGAALFLDDIYSAMPSREGSGTRAVVKEDARERISRIQEIYAGAGDDLVDLTSARFGCDDGIAVYGGAGNDILWGGGDGCCLFGDEGDDSLSGTAGNDILVGGNGNDVIQCLGGEDILCFGPDWGNDLVIQQAGGKATLWFAEGDERFWDAEAMVYSDGVNSVRIAGSVTVADITLKFGNDGSELYSCLRDRGAFLA